MQLVINRLGVVRKGRMKLWVLPKTGVLLPVNLQPYLRNGGAGAAQALYLREKVCEIIAEACRPGLCPTLRAVPTVNVHSRRRAPG
jgi:hypothetical protein